MDQQIVVESFGIERLALHSGSPRRQPHLKLADEVEIESAVVEVVERLVPFARMEQKEVVELCSGLEAAFEKDLARTCIFLISLHLFQVDMEALR